MKVLIVEDEMVLRDEIIGYLTERGFVCEAAGDFAEGQAKIAAFDYDAVVLDITLPGGSGMDLLKDLKKKETQAGVLILSARDSLNDKITGFDLGADDYLTKPFFMEELNARVNAIIRRRSFNPNDTIRIDGLEIDPGAKTVYYLHNEIMLTKKEFELLLFFIDNKNRVVSKQAIFAHLWGDEFDGTESLDTIYVHTMNLRKKIVKYTGTDYIKTVHGMGYKWTRS